MIRIKPDRIFDELKTLDGIQLNVVLNNGTTYFGTLRKVTNDFLNLEDTRHHSHKFLLTGIYEIVYDYQN